MAVVPGQALLPPPETTGSTGAMAGVAGRKRRAPGARRYAARAGSSRASGRRRRARPGFLTAAAAGTSCALCARTLLKFGSGPSFASGGAADPVIRLYNCVHMLVSTV